MATSNGGSDGDARRPFVLEVPSGRWDEADGAADENLNSSHSSDHTETPSTRPSGSARERRRRKRGGDFTSGEWHSPPEDKLPIATKMAEAHMRNKQIPEAMTELIRCVALSRIVFGDEHWQVAQAYANLAHGYLSLRGLALQAKLHCETGQAIMLTAPHSPSSPGERTNILKTLFTIYCTLGKANTHLKNLKEAEQCLLRAEQIANELSKTGMVLEREQGEMDLEVTQALGRLSIQQEKPALAVEQLQKTLKLLQLSVGEDSPELIPAYQDLAHAEDARQNHQQTIENLLQAHSIALASYTTDSKEAAETAHIMAKACAAAKDEEFEGLAEKYFVESLNSYELVYGTDSPEWLCVQDDLCHLLVRAKRHQEAIVRLQISLNVKASVFGEFSKELAETHHLMGGIRMAEGQLEKAYKHLNKCLDVQTILYGAQHKKTKSTQKTLDMLSKAPSMANKQKISSAESIKGRPLFTAVVSRQKPLGGTKGNVYD
ncbi:tetratricopeptide repeat protein 23 [Lethenteron reissneri]|uniref:tetratricopeptide repeat protein 23 n=1 Tax=Lethenteron reissneri TaxID=7753 RepID=UPI002AB7E6DF|nr:tetratricopeptide repeat protein 23 [Lethenteron reissneri]